MIKVNVKRTQLNTTQYEKNIMRTLRNITTDIRKLIRNRTATGVDVNHNAFAPYSEGYKAQKQKLDLSGEKVTLRASGLLMRNTSYSIKAGYRSYILYINDANRAAIGYFHQIGKGKLPVRYWFGVSQTDADKIYKSQMATFPVVTGL